MIDNRVIVKKSALQPVAWVSEVKTLKKQMITSFKIIVYE